MFTGLVETIGTVTDLTSNSSPDGTSSGTTLTISSCSSILDPSTAEGDSISINGTCLTVTSFSLSSPSWFRVGIAPETLRRTNLGSLTSESRVNLERAVSASTRMGGHFVQGHVDTVAQIASITPDGEALTFRFALPSHARQLLKYIVEKGYVTLDGASLTVTNVQDAEGWFEVMLITYTQEKIVTSSKKVGDGVNVEIDVVGKYVEKSVGAYFGRILQDEKSGAGGGQEEDGEGLTSPEILRAMVNHMVDQRIKDSGALQGSP